jgi:16S rRNA (adenine1518-N6/adenine1519-N6)-dimethyltransferase
LRSLGIRLDVDRLDQHVLVDSAVVQLLVDAARLEPSDVVLEIGPGPGTITQELARRAGRVVAIEVDTRFRPLLDRLPANVEVRYADAGRAGWPRLDALVCNPPYGLVEVIVRRLFGLRPRCAALIVGAATRRAIAAPPGGGQFTRLSLIVQAAYEVDFVAELPRDAFAPKPRTSSSIVRLRLRVGRTGLRPLADAIVREPGARVNDVLWRAGRGDLRSALRTTGVLHRRLQSLSNAELSALAAALTAD